MKFATHVLCFGQEKWLMKNIQNSYSHVDKIYIAYSDKPWNYNPKARNLYTIPMDLSIIRNSIYADKIEIIEGVWDTEEAQRNACLDFAKKDKIDFLFIHDADEFYTHADFQKMIQWISSNPKYSLYRCPWYSFWKSSEYITIKEDGNLIVGYPDICINLNHNIRFQNKRTVTKNNIGVIDNVICYHMSFVLTDEEVKRKIETWGHHNDFNTQNWYENIWLKWNENLIGLHPIQPNEWYKAVIYTGTLPEVLKN